MLKRLAILICLLETLVVAGIAALGPRENQVTETTFVVVKPVPQEAVIPEKPVAKSEPGAVTPFKFPKHCKAVSVRAEVSPELDGRLTLGTKLDVLLILGKKADVMAETVLSGVFYVPISTQDTLNEESGEQIERVTVTLALTDQQIIPLIAAEERGTLRIVPAK